MTTHFARILSWTLLVAATSVLHAQVPQLINYQGRIVIGTTNFDGTGRFKFALVDGGGHPSTQAQAKANVTGMFVTSITVQNGGSGYPSPPAVSFTGGGGSGATATAILSGGSVVSIVVNTAGTGYSSKVDVVIAPPPADHVRTLWSNDGSSGAGSQPNASVELPVSKGLYSVLLGDTSLANMTAIPNAVFANSDVRLRVWFDDGANGSQLLTPDQRIAAVGYAMMAGGLQPGTNITAGTVTATSFSGDGTGLTNIRSSAIVPAPPGMALIPAGTFTMGNTVAADTDLPAPVSVTVSAFYMDVDEVTLSEWQSVYYWATSNGYNFTNAGSGKAANHPVQTVNWYDCVKWCNARSEQAGLTPVYYTNDAQTAVYRTGEVDVTNGQVKWNGNGYRLPTEAEWEKAARGGLSGQRFPWGNTISQNLANYSGQTTLPYDQGPNGYNAIGSVGGISPPTSPVGSFAANGYGLKDMAGNVMEWCWDNAGGPLPGGTDPHGPAASGTRIHRGGCGDCSASMARCANRLIIQTANTVSNAIGFRTVVAESP